MSQELSPELTGAAHARAMLAETRPAPFVIIAETTPKDANRLAFPGDHAEALQEQEALARSIGGSALSKLVEGQMAFAVVVDKDPEGNETATHYVALNNDIGTAVRPGAQEGGYFKRHNVPEPEVARAGLREADRKKAEAQRIQDTINGHRKHLETVFGVSQDGDESRLAALYRTAESALAKVTDPAERRALLTDIAIITGGSKDRKAHERAALDHMLPAVEDETVWKTVRGYMEQASIAVAGGDPAQARHAYEQVGQLADSLSRRSVDPSVADMIWGYAAGIAARQGSQEMAAQLLGRVETSLRKEIVA